MSELLEFLLFLYIANLVALTVLTITYERALDRSIDHLGLSAPAAARLSLKYRTVPGA